MNIKLRYKKPDGNTSVLIEHPLKDESLTFNNASGNLRFAASVAAFGMLLRNSDYKGSADFSMVIKTAKNAVDNDEEGYKKQFVDLVKKASKLQQKKLRIRLQQCLMMIIKV